VILRGVNLAGNSKVPPFRPISNESSLDLVPQMGFNTLRLVFIWEAFEPQRGIYNYPYLTMMRSVAAAAWARGLYVIVDFHQDGFSRFTSRGSGDGFPPWTLSHRATPCQPDNSARCKDWALRMATDIHMHRSFTDFYADTVGVRTAYLQMLQLAAREFAQVPGVIGYDPINEPWGNERDELYPFYQDAASVIRAEHPTAILFLEGHVTTNCGLQTRLPNPQLENVAYAPHFYKPAAILRNSWRGMTGTINRAFAHMEAKAAEWNVPLFVGEYGIPANAYRAGDYMAYLHNQLDKIGASGAQWNYTPGWNQDNKDGWNGEDFTLIDTVGRPRPNFRLHPYPKAVAGVLAAFEYTDHTSAHMVNITWEHQPARGDTELFLPNSLFGSAIHVRTSSDAVVTYRDERRQTLVCRSGQPGFMSVSVQAQ
jgi:endoglycosylceramidase